MVAAVLHWYPKVKTTYVPIAASKLQKARCDGINYHTGVSRVDLVDSRISVGIDGRKPEHFATPVPCILTVACVPAEASSTCESCILSVVCILHQVIVSAKSACVRSRFDCLESATLHACMGKAGQAVH